MSNETQSSSSDLDIKVGVGLEEYSVVANKVNKLLKELEKNYEFKLKVDTTAITQIKEAKKATEEIQKASKATNANNSKFLGDIGRGYKGIVAEMKKIHGKDGALVKVTEFGKNEKSLDKFTVEIRKAGGEVEKLSYKFNDLQKKFEFDGKRFVDTSHIDKAKRVLEVDNLKTEVDRAISKLGDKVSADTLANPKIVSQIESVKKAFVGLKSVIGEEFAKRIKGVKDGLSDLVGDATSIDKAFNKSKSEMEDRIADVEALKKEFDIALSRITEGASADTLASPQIVNQIENIKNAFEGLENLSKKDFSNNVKGMRKELSYLSQDVKAIDSTSSKREAKIEAEEKAWFKLKIAQDKALLNLQKLEQQNPKPFSFDEVAEEAKVYSERLAKINSLPLDEAQKEVKELEVAWKSLQNKVNGIAAEYGRKDTNWLSTVAGNTKKFFEWYVSANLITQSKEAMTSAIREIGVMDKATVELTKVTDMSNESLKDMQNTAKGLAREMGKLAPEIVDSMAEFGRITKDAELIKELTRSATLGSNVTSMSPDEMAKAINTTVLSMNLELKDSMMILDQFNSIQNSFRTNAEDLADSISAVGSAATQVGIPLEKLNGYTTALTSSLGIDGGEVGVALKSMISRIYRIGDEGRDGQAEKILNSLGVKVKDLATGELVDFDNILQQIKGSWDDFTETQQMAIAQAIGGTMHYSRFIGLINNLDVATKASETALNSQGSALIENAKALDSISGKWNLLKTNMSNIKINLVDNENLKSILDLGIGITGLIEKVGMMKVLFAGIGALKFGKMDFLNPIKEAKTFGEVFNVLGGGMRKVTDEVKLFKNAFGTYFSEILNKIKTSVKNTNLSKLSQETRDVGVAAKTSSSSLRTLWSTISSGGVVTGVATFALKGLKLVLQGLAGMGIGLAIAFATEKLMSFITKVVNAKNELKKFNEEARELTNTNVSNVSSGESALSELELLERQRVNSSGTEKLEIDKRILELQKELARIFPSTVTGYTKEGEAIAENINLIKDFINFKKEEIKTKAEDVLKENKGISETMKNIDALEERRDKMRLALAKGDNKYTELKTESVYNHATNKMEDVQTEVTTKVSEKALSRINEQLEREKELLSLLTQQVSALKSVGVTDEQIAKLGYDLSSLNEELEKTNENLPSNSQVAEVSELEQAYLDLGYSVEEVNEKMLGLTDISESSMNDALVQDSTKVYGEAIASVQELRQSIEDLNEEGAFTPKLIAELLEQYPQMAELGARVNDFASVQEFLNDKILEHTKVQNNAYQNMIANDKEYYNAKMRNSDEYLNHVNSAVSAIVGNNIEGYNLDLGNYTSYNGLKTGMLEKFGTTNGQAINSLLDMYTKAYNFDIDNFADLNAAKQGYINATLPVLINWINQLVSKNSNGYTYDLSNFNTLAELKAKVISDLSAKISQLQTQWNNAKRIEEETRIAAAKTGARLQQIHMDSWDATGTSRGDEGSYSNWLQHQINTITAQINTVDKVFGGLEQAYNAIDSKFTGANFTSGKVGSGGDKKGQDERVKLEEEANRKIEALRDKLISSLKKKYDELRKKEIEPLDAEIKRKQEELDRLNNGGMDDTQKLKALREELALWKKNDSVFSKDKIAELEKSVKEAELNLEIKNLEDKKEVINNKYDALLQEEKLYAEASNMIQKNKYDEMKNLLLVYGEEFKDISLLLGESIANIIKVQLDELKEAYNFLKGVGGTSSQSSGSSAPSKAATTTSPKANTSSNTSISKGSRVKVKDVGTSIYLDSYGRAVGTWKGAGVSANESLYVVNTSNGRAALSRTNNINGALGWIDLSKIAKFKIGGDVGSWNSATDNGKMAIVHSGERVLTSEQNKAFSDLVYKTLPSLKNIPNNLLGYLKGVMASNINNGGDYQFVFHNSYDVTNQTDMDVRNFQRRVQIDIEKYVKSALNKAGIRTSF